MAHRRPIGVALAPRAHDLRDFGLHRLGQHAQPDPDRQREQSVLRGVHQLPKRLLHARRQRQLLAGDLLLHYGLHAVLLSSRTRSDRLSRSQHERTRREDRHLSSSTNYGTCSAIALEWRDVDWDGSALNIVRAAKDSGVGTPKGDRSRRVAIDPYLLDLLRQHRSAAARDGELAKLVFRSPTGRMLDRHNVRRRGHDAALRRAGLPSEVRLHDLRHTAATLWLAAGASIYFVQQQLGHKDIQTTIDLYGHPDQAAHREAAARAAQWWREDASA
jgi:integrase